MVRAALGPRGEPARAVPARCTLATMAGEDPSSGNLTKRGVAAYQGALEAVLAIAIAAGAGYWADGHFGTSPRWLIVGTIVGFASFVVRLWRMRGLFDEGPPPPDDLSRDS